MVDTYKRRKREKEREVKGGIDAGYGKERSSA